MKPKLTIAVRRGLKALAMLAESDLDADQSMECPRYNRKEAQQMEKALRWISCLDDERPPKVDQASAAAAVEASNAIEGVKPANVFSTSR